jgi:hypothetical protein
VVSAFTRNLDRGKVEERKLAAYLKALSFRVLPTTDFSARGAPMLEAEDRADSLVMPDLQAFRDGSGAWFECKWKTEGTMSSRRGRVETGVSRRHYEHYKKTEAATKIPVAIVFVHESEREVRCGTLSQLEGAFSHEYTGDKMGPSGMRFWIYDQIPLWMSLDELNAAIAAHQCGASLIRPVEPPVDHKLLPQQRSHALRKHVDGEIIGVWTWACLQCNETGSTPAERHRCDPARTALCRERWASGADYWAKRLKMALGEKADISSLITRPISRALLSQWLGPTWSPEKDFLS